MRRTLWMLIAVALFSPLWGSAQTVDEVIAKNIQARGGLEKLHTLQSLRFTAKFSQGSFRADYVQENKRAEKVREELIIQGMAQVQAYDGKSGWQINPFGGRKDPELMSADDTKSLAVDADIEGPLVDYKQKGHKAELMGHDSIEGTDCFKIKLTMKNGDIRLYYLDADSYLELKFETQSNIRGAVQYNDTFLGDYEEVGGIYFPFAIETAEVGSDNRQRFTVEKVELNIPLEDAKFSMPASKAEAKPGAGM
jgi:hypothetical protein